MTDHPGFDLAMKLLATAAIAAGSGYASHQVSDGKESAIVLDNRSQVLALQDDVRLIRAGFTQRVDLEENAREDEYKKIEHRLTRIETLLEIRLGVAPMPAAAAAEAATPPNR